MPDQSPEQSSSAVPKWNDVLKSERFQSLSDEKKEVARRDYFDRFVAPKAPENRRDQLRQQWDDISVPTLEPYLSRSWSDVAKDAGKSLAAGFTDLGGAAAQVGRVGAQALSQPSQMVARGLDKAGFTEDAEGAIERAVAAPWDAAEKATSEAGDYWRQSQSAPLQRAREEVGDADTFGDAVSAAIDNPMAIGDILVSSAPHMLVPGAAARRAGLKAGQKAIQGGASKEAAKQAATKAGAKSGATVGGVMEGAMGGSEARQEVLDMTPEELFKGSQAYSDLRQQDVSHEDAVRQLADKAGLTAQAISTPLSILMSRATGAAEVEADFFTGQGVKNFFSALAKETAEEAGQEASQGLGVNVGVGTTADDSREYTEGLGADAALGGMVGGAQAGGMKALGGAKEGAGTLVERGLKNRSEPEPDPVSEESAPEPEGLTPGKKYKQRTGPGSFTTVEFVREVGGPDGQPMAEVVEDGQINYAPMDQLEERLPVLDQTPDEIEADLTGDADLDAEIQATMADLQQADSRIRARRPQEQPQAAEQDQSAPEGTIPFEAPQMPEAARQESPAFELEPMESFGRRQYEGGVDFEPGQVPRQPEDTSVRDQLAGSLQQRIDQNIDQKIESRLPEGLPDRRLIREEYRTRLESMAQDLTKGGGVGYVRNENDVITGRTPSLNPDWFKNMDLKISVEETQGAVQKALKGEKLGKRQAAVVELMLDEAQEQRAMDRPEAVIERWKRLDDLRQGLESNSDSDILSRLELEPLEGESATEAALAELVDDAEGIGIPEAEIQTALERYSGRAQGNRQQLLAMMSGWLRAEGYGRREAAESGSVVSPGRGNAGSQGTPTDARGAQGQESSDLGGDSAADGIPFESGEVTAEQTQATAEALGIEPDPALESYTEQDLAVRAERERQAEQEQAQTRQREEQRATADRERDDFVLSGSDTAADQAAARGQEDLLAPAPKGTVKADETKPRALDQHIKSNTEANPSEAQKDAGNYRKAKINVQGLDISIENPRGTKRSGTDPDGKPWSVTMKSSYGYIRKTEGADGDHVDVFVGPNPSSEKVFVVDQVNADGSFDEHKAMVGYDSRLKARSGYKANYTKNWKVGPITPMTMEEFKTWVKEGDTKKPLNAELAAKGSKPSQETKPKSGTWTGQMESYAKDEEAKADDWESREYKKSNQTVNLEGDGPMSRETVSVNYVNEKRRRARIDEHRRNARVARELAKRQPDAMLKEYTDIHDRVSGMDLSAGFGGANITFEQALIGELNQKIAGTKDMIIDANSVGGMLMKTLEPMRLRQAENRKRQEEAAEAGRRQQESMSQDELMAEFLGTTPEETRKAREAEEAKQASKNNPRPKESKPDQKKKPAREKPAANKSVKEAGSGGTMFSLGSESTVAGPVSKADAEVVVSRVRAGLRNRDLEIHAVEDFTGFPAEVQEYAQRQGYDGSGIEGVFHNGSIYVNRSALKSQADVERVLFHELFGHYGLRNLFGSSTKQAMNRLYLAVGGAKGIRDMAANNNIDLSAYSRGMGAEVEAGRMDRDTYHSIMMEELLAHIAQDNRPGFKRNLKELVGRLRAWLSELGLVNLSRMGESDIFNLLRLARESVVSDTVQDGEVIRFALGAGRGVEAFRGMSREEFLGSPTITGNRNAADLKPKDITSDAESEPFMDGYTVKMDPFGAAVYDGDKVIASYNFGANLVVDKGYRRQGIAEELVYQWRTRYPGRPKADSRTRASQAIQEKVWARIQEELKSDTGSSNTSARSLDSAGGGAQFARYTKLGDKPVSIEQTLKDVSGLIGFDVPFDVRVRDDLPPGVPMRFNLQSGEIEASGQKAPRWKAAQWLMEEALHGIDVVRPDRTISSSSKLLAKGGAIRQEAQAAWDNRGPLWEHVRYPLDSNAFGDLTESQIKAELFARLGVVYLGDPQLLKEVMPRAYAAYNQIFGLEPESPVGDSFIRRKVWSGNSAARGQVRREHRTVGQAGRDAERARGAGPARRGLGPIRQSIGKAMGGHALGAKVQFPGGVNGPETLNVAGASGEYSQSSRRVPPEQRGNGRNEGGLQALGAVDEGTAGERSRPETPLTDDQNSSEPRPSAGVSRSGVPQTETDAFKRWFGDSKVVNESGEPLVVYHGTPEVFDTFDTDSNYEQASYFTANKETAETFAEEDGEPAGGVMEVYLSIQNPKVIDGREFSERGYDQTLLKKEFDKARAEGHDGVILQGVEEFGGSDDQFITFHPEQIKSATGNTGAFDPADPDIRFSLAPDEDGTFNPPEERRVFGIPVDGILRVWADKMRPLLLTQKEIKRSEGKDFLPEEVDAYLAEEAFHGKTENDLRKLRETYLEPMTEKMAEYGVSREELDMFLWARHAEERNKQIAKINPDMPDGGSGMSTRQAREVLAKSKREGTLKQLHELSQYIYRMHEQRRELMRDTLLEEGEIDAWQESYEFYVPLKGQAADESGKSFPRIGKGFDVRGKETLRALGRRTQPESPVLHSIRDTTETIIRHRKNEVGNVFLDMVEKYPNPDYWQVFTKDSPEMETRLLKQGGEEVVGEAVVIDKSQYFITKRNGKEHYIKLADEKLLRAMKNMGPEPMNSVMRFLGATSRFLSSVNTSYNPEFMITNASRDIQTAVINVLAEQDLYDGRAKGQKLVGKMVKGVPIAARAIHASLRNKKLTGKSAEWQTVFDQFREDGAKTGWFDMKDVDGQARELETMLEMSKGSFKGRLLKVRKKIGDVVENANTAVENAVRLSVYKAALEAGVSRKRATNLAKNLTVNFNRKGEIGQTLNSLYMFANASIQGTATFARAIGTLNIDAQTGKRKLNMAQKFGVGTAVAAYGLAMLNREMAGEDDDGDNLYDEVDDWRKERNIIIMKSIFGGEPGEHWQIPLPYGYNIFHVFGTQVEAVASGNSGIGEGAGEITKAFLGSFSPIGVVESETVHGTIMRTGAPTLLKPLADLSENENFWGGRIYRENLPFGTPKPDSQLAKKSTNVGWKWLAEFMNDTTGGSQYRSGWIDVNPDKMSYLFDFFTGSAGAFYSRTFSAGVKTAQGRELEDREIPFYRQVSGEVSWYDDQSKFYNRSTEVEQLDDEWRALRGGERFAFRKKHNEKLKLKALAGNVQSMLKQLRDQRDRIEENESLSAKQKDQRLKRIEERMKRQIDRFNKQWPDD